MDDDKIVLDRKSFEALAVDSRVRILKSLEKRRKTLSELAKEQKMSISGVKEHLETLENVGLIEKIDDGHKWKYYELTRKGREIVAPKEIRVWILLIISMFALVISLNSMISMQEVQTADEPIRAYDEQFMVASTFDNNTENLALNTGVQSKTTNKTEIVQDDIPEHTGLVEIIIWISSLTMFGCIIVLIKNRLNLTPK
ncbi:MAG: winged helix-turn-helix domain-containing protein [Candidatus Micrarchaeota archaeon]